MEEHRLRTFDNRVLRGIFGPKRDEVTRDEENCVTKGVIIYTLHHILSG
jgi:hypothetical protein